MNRLCHFVSLRPSQPSTCRCSHSLWLSVDLSERNQMRRHFLETTSAKAHETKLRIKLKSPNSRDMVKDLWTCNTYVTACVIYSGRIRLPQTHSLYLRYLFGTKSWQVMANAPSALCKEEVSGGRQGNVV